MQLGYECALVTLLLLPLLPGCAASVSRLPGSSGENLGLRGEEVMKLAKKHGHLQQKPRDRQKLRKAVAAWLTVGGILYGSLSAASHTGHVTVTSGGPSGCAVFRVPA
jgi:hypothetical protein